jgi:hypothetical protein
MVRVLASSVVDRGFDPRSCQTKDYKIGICCFSAKHSALRRAKTGWLGIRIMCSSGATCLPANCCFSELALLKCNKADLTIIMSLKINLFSPWYSWTIAELALNNNHSLTHSLTSYSRVCVQYSDFQGRAPNRYNNYTVVIMNWLTVTKYPYLK